MDNIDRSIKAQFEVERQLRERILCSSEEERQAVIEAVYVELFERFPSHEACIPSDEERRRKGQRGAGQFGPLTRRGDCVLEVGCGRGDVIAELARRGRTCFGIEASQHMLAMCPSSVVTKWGTADRLDFADESFDCVFSQQVLEHLHPDDVPKHFAEAFRILRVGGILAVETPNRTTGPQDVSRGFTPVAQGLHLKEWSVGELVAEFKKAGFVHMRGLCAPPFLSRRYAFIHRISRVPAGVKRIEDRLLSLVPGLALRTFIGKVIGLEDIFLYGRKSGSVPRS